jgi:hypothetical protein
VVVSGLLLGKLCDGGRTPESTLRRPVSLQLSAGSLLSLKKLGVEQS